MALLTLNMKPKDKELRQFALLWTPLFLLTFAAFAWWRQDPAAPSRVPLILVGIVVVVAALGAVAPVVVRPLYVALIVVTFPIGFIVSHVLLFVLYFGVFTPVGLVLRATGHDPMKRTIDRSARSYFVARNRVDDVGRYFRQY